MNYVLKRQILAHRAERENSEPQNLISINGPQRANMGH